MKTANTAKPCYFSPKAVSAPDLPPRLRKLASDLNRSGESGAFAAPVVAAFASELISSQPIVLPAWSSGSATRFLVIADVPEPALLRLSSALALRKPEQRLHLTRDPGAVRRLLISSVRREPFLGIVDAYIWEDALNLVTGDFQFRSFPLSAVPIVSELAGEERGAFEIGEDGSYLHWPARDLHLGVSQILQAADPMYLADIAIERHAQDHTGAALRSMREEKGLRQCDIPSLSERQVRRIEEGISRLRVDAADKFASAFGIGTGELLDEIARRAGRARRETEPQRKGRDEPRPRARA